MSDIDTEAVNSLKVLAPNRPIREATKRRTSSEVAQGPKRDIGSLSATVEPTPPLPSYSWRLRLQINNQATNTHSEPNQRIFQRHDRSDPENT